MLRFDCFLFMTSLSENGRLLTTACTGGGAQGRSKIGKSRGKHYFEFEYISTNTNTCMFGVINEKGTYGLYLYDYDNSFYVLGQGSTGSYMQEPFGCGAVIRFGLDCDSGTLSYAINGGSRVELSLLRITKGTYFPCVYGGASVDGFTVRINGEANTCKYPAFQGYRYWGDPVKVDRKSLLTLPVAKGGGF